MTKFVFPISFVSLPLVARQQTRMQLYTRFKSACSHKDDDLKIRQNIEI